MVDEKKSEFELLEHVIKGVHVEGRGPKNHRVVPRPLDRVNDAARRTKRRARPKRSR